MPKTRAYTRDELQGLRRADLQRLCKTYNIKGANAKSDVLITTLADYFTSPEYLESPTKTDANRPRPPPPRRPTRPLHGPASRAPSRAQPSHSRPSSVQTVPSFPPQSSRSTRPISVTSAASTAGPTARPQSSIATGTSQPRAASTATKRPPARPHAQPSLPPRHATQPTQPVRPSVQIEPATPSSSHSDPQQPLTKPPPQHLPTSPPTDGCSQTLPSNSTSTAPVNEIASLRAEVLHLRDIIAKLDGEALLRQLEQRIEDRISAAVAEQLAIIKQREEVVAAQEILLADTMARIEAFQQKMLDSAIIQGQEPLVLPPQESAHKRKDPQSDVPEPTPKRMCLPSGVQTPPPLLSAKASEAPSTPDSSRYRVAPRTPPLQRGPSADYAPTPGRDLSPRGLLPFPGGGTSPTVDRSERIPSRQPSRTKPSQAHIDLSAITESDDVDIAPGPSRHPFRGSIAIDRLTVTPPALSPSPQIGGDNYTHTPLPPPFARAARSSSSAPSPQISKPRFDPQRTYMDVALNGFPEDYSPSGQATPSSRTMLGTERFRDNRFGDEPMISWPSPRLDYGPDTPSNPTTRYFE